MIFFTADTHLGHKNIIRFCDRPFNSVEEMDNTIIDNWNKVVGKKDTVYHLGDFMSWKTREAGSIFDKYRSYRNRLNGSIYLVEGNHDYKIGSPFPHSLKAKYQLHTIKHQGRQITLCHYAMRVWPASHFDSWHLYGHSHGLLEPIGKCWDVGVDNNDFTPLSFNQLGAIMDNQPHNENYIER